MHKTTAEEKRKALREKALELAKEAKAPIKAAKILPEARKKARALEGQAGSLKAEADSLKGAARREDLSIWVMENVKTTKKGSKTYGSGLPQGEKAAIREYPFGKLRKMNELRALQKARKMKADALWALFNRPIIIQLKLLLPRLSYRERDRFADMN